MTDERRVIVQSPIGVVMSVSAEIGAGSGHALMLTRVEALALVAASDRFKVINPVVANVVRRDDAEPRQPDRTAGECVEVAVENDAGNTTKVTIKFRGRGHHD